MSAPSVYVTPVPHGTVSGYSYHGCREECCKQAMREYNRQWAAANPGYFAKASKRLRQKVRLVGCTSCSWRGRRAGIPTGGGGPKPCPRCRSRVEPLEPVAPRR